ncbi:MAG: hypothetical protein ABUS47_16465 [Steroidobacter sp.]
MRFLTFDPAAQGATLFQEQSGEWTFKTTSNFAIPLARVPDMFQAANKQDLTPPMWAVEQSAAAIAELDHTTVTINRDPRYSGFGKSQQLTEPRNTAIAKVVLASDYLEKHAAKIAEQESKRYAVPSIEKNDFAAVLADQEIRAWARSLNGDARSELIRNLDGEKSERVLLALCRSPVVLDVLDKAASEAWRISVDRRDPEGRARLDLENQMIQWARTGIAHVVGNINKIHGLSREELHAAIKIDSGFKLFGFSAYEKLNFDRKAMAKRKTA